MEPNLRITTVKLQAEQQRISFPANCSDTVAAAPISASPPVKDKLRVTSAGMWTRFRLNTLDMVSQPDALSFQREGGFTEVREPALDHPNNESEDTSTPSLWGWRPAWVFCLHLGSKSRVRG